MNVVLQRFTIEHLRSLTNITLEDLGQFNVLVGPNNSGKTSFLEALEVFCDPTNPLTWVSVARSRETRGVTPARPGAFSTLDDLKWMFPQHDRNRAEERYDGVVSLRCTGTSPVSAVSARLREIMGTPAPDEFNAYATSRRPIREDDPVRRGMELEVSGTFVRPGNLPLDTPLVYRFWEDMPFVLRGGTSGLIPVRVVGPLAHRAERAHVRELTAARFMAQKDEVVAAARSIEADVVDLEVWSPRGDLPRLYVNHKLLGLTPLSAEGDGFRRAILIAAAAVGARGGLLLIDEIEAGLHPQALREVYSLATRLCRRHKVCMIATTHSLEAVDALIDATETGTGGLVVYHLPPVRGAGVVQRFAGDQLRRLRFERGLDLR
ncbi:MAG: AAA family ATPase [Armatimonadetes bacterium]|nr:AAA family ATPase [Armatimonadota bacterium]